MRSGRAEINVTPMIDVLLVLLIIFMMIGPPRSMGLPALAPSPSDGGDSRPVIVTVATGRLALNGMAIGADSLESALDEIFRTRAEKVLFVKGEAGVEFDAVAHVVDVARGVGIERIALLPSPR